MTTSASIGVPIGGRPVNLSQLQDELVAANVGVTSLGMSDGYVYVYDADGQPADFTPQQTPIVQTAINAHVGMRDKTTEEYAAEFQNANTSAARKQEIRDITAGLLPAEQVPMT